MKEKIESKINEVLEAIMAKDARAITYNEYRILDNRLSALKWEADRETKNKELTELMIKTVGGFGGAPTPLGAEEA